MKEFFKNLITKICSLFNKDKKTNGGGGHKF